VKAFKKITDEGGEHAGLALFNRIKSVDANYDAYSRCNAYLREMITGRIPFRSADHLATRRGKK